MSSTLIVEPRGLVRHSRALWRRGETWAFLAWFCAVGPLALGVVSLVGAPHIDISAMAACAGLVAAGSEHRIRHRRWRAAHAACAHHDIPRVWLHGSRSGTTFHHGLDANGVETAVVIGHSGCSAMTAGLDIARREKTTVTLPPHLGQVVRRWRAGHPAALSAAALGLPVNDQLSQVCIALTVDGIRAREVHASGRVSIVGLWFDVATGTLHRLDGEGEDLAFEILTEDEVRVLAPVLAA